jgi:hypothetical protein
MKIKELLKNSYRKDDANFLTKIIIFHIIESSDLHI